MREQKKLLIGTGVIGTLALAIGIGLHWKAKDEERQFERMLRSTEFKDFYIDEYEYDFEDE